MTRKELIRMYCQLREATAETFEESTESVLARDCFCDDSPITSNFQDEIFDFIKSAVSYSFQRKGCEDAFQRIYNRIKEYDAKRDRESDKGNEEANNKL